MKIFANQAHQFESKEIFRKLSRKSEIKVVGIAAGDAAKKIQKVKEKVENEGFLDIAFVNNGTHVRLSFFHCYGFNFLENFQKFPEIGNFFFKSGILF